MDPWSDQQDSYDTLDKGSIFSSKLTSQYSYLAERYGILLRKRKKCNSKRVYLTGM